MKVFKTFLESSTIHGLGYISTSKSGVEKLAWASFVLTGFSLAAYLILTSYIDMQDSPVSTSISTHPTSSLEQSCKKQNEATNGLKSRDPTYLYFGKLKPTLYSHGTFITSVLTKLSKHMHKLSKTCFCKEVFTKYSIIRPTWE